MKGTIATIGGAILTVSATLAPVIPEEMAFKYAYETVCGATPSPDFPSTYQPTCVKGQTKAYVSVFEDSNGNKVYADLTEEQYKNMGKTNGSLQNPTKDEYKSVFDLLTETKTASAAIAFDAGVIGPFGNPATSITYSHTFTGSNGAIFAGIVTNNGVSSITYNGTALTQVDSVTSAVPYILYDYLLLNPSSGSNNVVMTIGSSGVIIGGSVTYNGVAQTGQPDAHTTNDATTESTTNTSLTTVADNSWGVLITRTQSSGTSAAGTGTTLRANTDGYIQFYDGGGPKTPAGSLTLQSTQALQGTCALMISLAPYVAAGGSLVPNNQGVIFFE